ncbi:hypothetical protein WOLCODRAFT_18819 [Wolfiporia cocos MD-104 SS10]|uniref:RING-type domain-containing protein n=1 Tax=Wolfiporia cocos (strain MD-104) TaxID=742152 RepID=A0A2H3JZD2_WOLCO|nr:hypothetical protein WOLCODRAFT_18819 [Wolfiporia cocos MD-104 SS10]
MRQQSVIQYYSRVETMSGGTNISQRGSKIQGASTTHAAANLVHINGAPFVFSCTVCNVSFWTDESRQQHYLTSLSHPTCNLCIKGFQDQVDLESHNSQVHGLTKVKCNPCGKLFTPAELQQHFNASPAHPNCIHTADAHPDSRCSVCAQLFRDKAALQHHFDGSSMHPSCAICEVGFLDDAACDEHMVIAHPPRMPEAPPAPPMIPLEEEVYICSSAASVHSEDVTLATPSSIASELRSRHNSHAPRKCAQPINDVRALGAELRRKEGAIVYVQQPNTFCYTQDGVDDVPSGRKTPQMPSISLQNGQLLMESTVRPSSVLSVRPTTPPPQDVTRDLEPAAQAPILTSASVWSQIPLRNSELAPLERPSIVSTEAEDTAQEDATPNATTQTPQSMPTTLPPSKAISWHCRICLRDPCDQPTATMCGHLFCHRCIIEQLSENLQCPVCKKVRLEDKISSSRYHNNEYLL